MPPWGEGLTCRRPQGRGDPLEDIHIETETDRILTWSTQPKGEDSPYYETDTRQRHGDTHSEALISRNPVEGDAPLIAGIPSEVPISSIRAERTPLETEQGIPQTGRPGSRKHNAEGDTQQRRETSTPEVVYKQCGHLKGSTNSEEHMLCPAHSLESCKGHKPGERGHRP